MYAKVVTTGMTQWPETNEIIARNRRVGCSMTGIAQFVDKWGRIRLSEKIVGSPKGHRNFMNRRLDHLVREEGKEELIRWCEKGYKKVREWDATYSSWMDIPTSVKVTSIKPSGTVSLLGGATPGMHWPIERYYKRRMRIADTSPLLTVMRNAGYHIEDDVYADNTKVVTFPVYCGSDTVRTESEVSVREQFEMASLLQRHWADNQVSVTIKFWKEPTEEEFPIHLTRMLTAFGDGDERKLVRLLGPLWTSLSSMKVFPMLWDVLANFGTKPIRDLIDHYIECHFSIEIEEDDEEEKKQRIDAVLRAVKATELATLLFEYQDQLKAVSLLPMETGVYAQAPYERVTEDAYHSMLKEVKVIDNSAVMFQPEQPIGCDGDACTLAHSST